MISYYKLKKIGKKSRDVTKLGRKWSKLRKIGKKNRYYVYFDPKNYIINTN